MLRRSCTASRSRSSRDPISSYNSHITLPTTQSTRLTSTQDPRSMQVPLAHSMYVHELTIILEDRYSAYMCARAGSKGPAIHPADGRSCSSRLALVSVRLDRATRATLRPTATRVPLELESHLLVDQPCQLALRRCQRQLAFTRCCCLSCRSTVDRGNDPIAARDRRSLRSINHCH